VNTHALVHVALVLALPPLLPGIIAKTKALMAGRTGPPLLQPYFDLWKLLRKGAVYSKTTSWIFRTGPMITLAALLAASALLPLFDHHPPVSFGGDVIVFVYLLALGRFFTTAAALDTGSPFCGMGAARDVSFAALAEPALFFVFVVVSKGTGSTSLSTMLAAPVSAMWATSAVALVLALASLFAVTLAENARIPFDDPNTHLELTMIHEAMVLDHGGVDLAFILYGSSLKLLLFGAVLTRLALPIATGDPWLGWLVFGATQIAFAIVIGLVESTMARLRLVRIPQLLLGACLLSAFSLILLLR
jgi:formate hydrogenlyase subunit 4